MELFEKRKIILDRFPLHEKMEIRQAVNKAWDKNKWKIMGGFHTSNWLAYLQPFNFVADYYGEKYGFYFVWLIHYTSMLVIPALIGLAFFILQMHGLFGLYQKEKELPVAKRSSITTLVFREMDDGYNQIYCLIIIVWSTLLVESWKRKQSAISDAWLMRDFYDKTLERP